MPGLHPLRTFGVAVAVDVGVFCIVKTQLGPEPNGWCELQSNAGMNSEAESLGQGGVRRFYSALAPIFEDILQDMTKEVQSLCLG